MSNHHGRHRSRHSRSKLHHSSSSHYQSGYSRSRTSSSHVINNSNTSSSYRNAQHQSQDSNKNTTKDWCEHQSSSGRVYYYNTKTGVSQWEIPLELKQRQTSPESEISESSSIRHQQDKSPSSSASSQSARSDSISEDKPLLTPSLAHYFKPELIVNFNSSQIEELERQANQCARDALMVSERILKESVDLKIAKSVVHYVEISLEAQEKKYEILKSTIENYGLI